jgi:hypothetical protein
MVYLVRSAMLSLAVLSGVTSIAYAQRENLAALPPAPPVVAIPAPAPVAPATAVLGPDPGGLWSPPASQALPGQAAVQANAPVRITNPGGDTD